MRRKLLVAIACTLPLVAAGTATAQAPFTTVAADSGVDAYYAAHAQAPIWLKDPASRAAAEMLPALLRRAQVDGIEDGDVLSASVEGALSRGQPADDKIISAAWVRYVRTLKGPVERVSYGDPALAPRTPSATSILDKAARAVSLAAHVERVASVNPLYSELRKQALSAGAQGDSRVRAALEQLRLIPAKGRAIIVDVPSAEMKMIEDGRVVDSMKVIVGRKKTPTPLLAGTIHYVTLNPYWNIPEDVARDRVAPLVLKRGVKYLKAARYVTAAGLGKKAELVDPENIDWKAVADGDAPVHIRQLPGGNNMMGAMKFGFVNDYDIFLHDTPRRELFAKKKRTYSMGCIRLEHADRLARWLLGRDVAPEGDAPEQHVQLDKGVPIYVTYLTATVENGELAFAEDVYGLDAVAEAVEAAEPVISASSPSSR